MRSPFPSQHPQCRLGWGRGRLPNPKSRPCSLPASVFIRDRLRARSQQLGAGRQPEEMRQAGAPSGSPRSRPLQAQATGPASLTPIYFGVLVLAPSSPALSTHSSGRIKGLGAL